MLMLIRIIMKIVSLFFVVCISMMTFSYKEFEFNKEVFDGSQEKEENNE